MCQESARRWTRGEVESAFKAILMEAFGVEEDRINPSASLVQDLGAESIDLLDIGFRVQQTFGVELPYKAVQEKVLSWRNLGALRLILEDRYGANLPPEEMRHLSTKGIPEVLRWLQEHLGIPAQEGEAEKIAGELADRLASEVESLGFPASLAERERIGHLLLQNLSPPRVMEAMARLFTVESLVDFIVRRVGA